MTELKLEFPEKSGEYKVVQLEMDDVQYLWLTHYTTHRYGGGHPDCLSYLLEKEGGRFGMYPEHERRPYRRWEHRFATPEEQTDIVTYATVDDLLAAPRLGLDEHIPALSGDGYRVLGMGKVRIDTKAKTATFFGKSESYGIGLDTQQLSLLERLKPDWRIEK